MPVERKDARSALLRRLPHVAVDEKIIDGAQHGQRANGPERDLVQLAAHQRLVLTGLDADPAKYGAPDGGADQREEGKLEVVHPHDAGGDADEVAHDGQQARGEDAEAAKLRRPAFRRLDLGRSTSGRPAQRETQYIAVAPIHEPRAPARTMPRKVMLPDFCATMIAGGMISSLGSGTIELSIAISSTISG